MAAKGSDPRIAMESAGGDFVGRSSFDQDSIQGSTPGSENLGAAMSGNDRSVELSHMNADQLYGPVGKPESGANAPFREEKIARSRMDANELFGAREHDV